LGVPLSAPADVWRARYKALCLRMHPDKHREDEQNILAATAAFQRLKAAWEVLQKWQWMRQRIWEQHFSTEDCDIPHDAERVDEAEPAPEPAPSADSVGSSTDSDDAAESAGSHRAETSARRGFMAEPSGQSWTPQRRRMTRPSCSRGLFLQTMSRRLNTCEHNIAVLQIGQQTTGRRLLIRQLSSEAERIRQLFGALKTGSLMADPQTLHDILAGRSVGSALRKQKSRERAAAAQPARPPRAPGLPPHARSWKPRK
jgi:transcriptional regulator of acetoin/glycerol metabolism